MMCFNVCWRWVWAVLTFFWGAWVFGLVCRGLWATGSTTELRSFVGVRRGELQVDMPTGAVSTVAFEIIADGVRCVFIDVGWRCAGGVVRPGVEYKSVIGELSASSQRW